MSLMRCTKHDETYDTDFHECCPKCERDPLFDADVAMAESMMDLPWVHFTDACATEVEEVQS